MPLNLLSIFRWFFSLSLCAALAGCGVKTGPTPYVEAYPEKTPEAGVEASPLPSPNPSPSPLAVEAPGADNKKSKTPPKGKKKQ